MKTQNTKKQAREFNVLMGVIKLYIETGKPIGSHTLKEHGFQALSSATIRNYFAKLEKQGYLRQPHSSGGRIPTQDALKLYANEALEVLNRPLGDKERPHKLEIHESRNLMRYLQNCAEKLSELTGYASFLSSVRFDHDFILDIKLVGIDNERILAVLVTDFGQVLTEVLTLHQKLSSFALKRIESHLQWRIKGGKPPENLSEEENDFAQSIYNEIMVRYLVRYSNFSDEDIFRTGFSKLLAYPEFNDPVALTTSLSLFENTSKTRLLLNDCMLSGHLRYWIGNDLSPYASSAQGCSVIAIPYQIGQTRAGAIGILGPCRMPYPELFAHLKHFSDSISKSLTKSLLKFKLSFRQPRTASPYLKDQERVIVDQTTQKLLEIKDPPK
ncbi:MAG: Heat-inducible transcription repressor HrcA [Chlamydiales bacterium]|nr:Heat-inducible transcription repressor HrcA [Chlamydiales bacterium]